MENNDNKKSLTLRDLIGEEYLDYDLTIRPSFTPTVYGKTVTIQLEKDECRKKIVHTVECGNKSRPMTNLVDGCYCYSINYGDGAFVWSREVAGKVRAFVGLNNVYFGIVYPIGFDLNTRQFVRFPINELGLMDEKVMKELLKNQDFMNHTVGFDIDNYKEIMKYASLQIITDLLYGESFNIGTEVCDWIFDNLEKYNQDKILEVEQMFKEKDKIR